MNHPYCNDRPYRRLGRRPEEVVQGIGDADPPDLPEEPDESAGRHVHTRPRYIYRRAVDGGPVEPVLLEEAGRQMRGTPYFPWYWLGLLSAGQVIPARGFYYAADRRTVEAAT